VLRGATHYQLNTDEGYDALYRHLTDQPLTRKPELGKIRPMLPRERKQAPSELALFKSNSTHEKAFSDPEMTTPQEGPARILKGFQERQAVNATIYANPYDFIADIKDPHLFAGRRSEISIIGEELRRLVSATSSSPVVALVGERRVGKTSLLHRISELSAEVQYFALYHKYSRILAMSAGEFWYEVFQRLLYSANAAGAITDDDIREEIVYKPP
jgi:hypothetical protein